MVPGSDGMHQSSGSRLRKLLRDKEKEFAELTQSSFEALECEIYKKTLALEELQQQFKELKDDFLYNEGVLQERDDEIRALESRLQQETESHACVRKQLHESQGACSAAQSQLLIVRDRSEQLDSDLKSTRQHAQEEAAAADARLQEALRSVRSDFQHKLATQQQSAAEAASMAAATQQELRMQLQQAEVAIAAAQSAERVSEERAAAAAKQEAAAQESVAQSQAAVAAADAAAAEGGREVARLLWEMEEAQQATRDAKAAEERAQADAARAQQKETEAVEAASEASAKGEASRRQRDDAMTRAVEAELRAEAAMEEIRQARQKVDDAQQRCEAAVASAEAQQQEALTREQQLRAELQECAQQRDQAVQDRDTANEEAQGVVKGALDRANQVEKQAAAMEVTLVEANRNTAEAVQMQEASQEECKILRTAVSELEASLTATQQELLSAKQQLQDVQAAAQPLVQADAASTDGAAGVSVALQQRDAAVAAEVAAVTRAQASEAELELLRSQLQYFQRIAEQNAQQKSHTVATTTRRNQVRATSISPTEPPPEGAVCLTTAGSAMMRRARFRRAVSSAPTAADCRPGMPANSSVSPPPVVAAALPGTALCGSSPPSQSHAAGISRMNSKDDILHHDRLSQEHLDTDATSTAAEVGSMLRDSRALSLPDCPFPVQSPHPSGGSAEDSSVEQRGMLLPDAATGGHIVPDASAVRKELHDTPHDTALTRPEAAFEAVKLSNSESMSDEGSKEETELLRAALEDSKAQNAQLRASLAAMRADIELLQQRQLHAGADPAAQMQQAVPDTSHAQHSAEEQAGCSEDAACEDRPNTAAEGGTAVCMHTTERSRNESSMFHDESDQRRSECGDAIALQESGGAPAPMHASPVRDSSGPFTSIPDASLRAASLHAAIMAATGGESCALRALEGVVVSAQHAQRGCDAAVQVPELLEGEFQDPKVEPQGVAEHGHEGYVPRAQSHPAPDTAAAEQDAGPPQRDAAEAPYAAHPAAEQISEAEQSAARHQQERLRSELDAARACVQRLQGENERLMEVGAELRAERELLVSHLTPAFVDAVRSGTAPQAVPGGLIDTSAAGQARGAAVHHTLQSFQLHNGAEVDAHTAWAPERADGFSGSGSGCCAGGGFSHGAGQGWSGPVAHALPHHLQSVMDAGQWWAPPAQDLHACDFMCENSDPNTRGTADSLWMRESQVLAVADDRQRVVESQGVPSQPQLIQAVHNAESPHGNICAHSGLAEAPQQVQKCVDTSDLDVERQEVPVVTVGHELAAGAPWQAGGKGLHPSVRGSGQRWPAQNSARGTASQRIRLHALSKRRDGTHKVEGAKSFEPSIRARNWNLCDNGT